ncbi:acyl carrier protein [Streptomyces sp. SID13666]|uniref:acyl carrier protein n=1 Tax=Streptomyces TaxID=1883 RepID=UPI001106E263|nr:MULTISPECIES: acyl carrier protein [Streptomyces]MCZ4097872.1 acyl carrier protein [Streptomyces sp. H39-C1]NEA57539.1 acyl carrier protein [Streptomyces sp. SID13666]NEA70957.1 acyl carrier protein [Streptomyces sp. SID13588]QNA76721.1 acyl carrier protein [Streptomyces sp. So13.3]
MSDFTLQELTAKLRECAGEPDGVDLDGDVQDTPFMELGYDSLALLQVTGVIKRERRIDLSDDAVVEAETPRILLKMINTSLAQPS